MSTDFDVVIIGAGPGGISSALTLKDAGLSVALLDKRTFPRDKTCGDAIPGPTLKYLKEILSDFPEEFEKFAEKHRIQKSALFLPNGSSVSVSWKTKAYNSDRVSFDNFLFELVKKHSTTQIIENAAVEHISRGDDVVQLKVKGRETLINCKFLIGADGATSRVHKYLGEATSRLPQTVAIRAYYENVDFPGDTNGFYLLKNFPGYFWIFPLEDNLFNVGLGLLRSDLKKDFNLKAYMEEVVSKDESISKLFKNATLKSKVLGHNLTSFNKKIQISGERYVLVGDAAHLIDPIQGHGIDKAIKSGELAAQQVLNCFSQNTFSKSFISSYDKVIYEGLGKELQWNYKLMNIYRNFPWIVTLLQPFAKVNMDFFMKLFYRK
jgi:geranylgeranyl reductase family protein